jgi:hypothetical protein
MNHQEQLICIQNSKKGLKSAFKEFSFELKALVTEKLYFIKDEGLEEFL